MKFYSLFVLLLCAQIASAEPYFAIKEGFNCSACHVNPTGGGMRNSFGDQFAQDALPVTPLKVGSESWNGKLVGPINLGANARYAARQFDVDNVDTATSFDVDRVSIYVGATLNESVSFMLDQQVAPGGSLTRESWVKLSRGTWYLKAGKNFRPACQSAAEDGPNPARG